MLLVDLVPVSGMAYLTEMRSRGRRGRRLRLSRGGMGPGGGSEDTVVFGVTVVMVVALVVAPSDQLASARGIVNSVVVLLAMILVQAVGVVLHNRTRARR